MAQRRDFATLRAATRFMRAAVEGGGRVLVHCVQGISRSASVVAAYLMEYEGYDVDSAVAELRLRHEGALKPFKFQEMLRGFHYFLRARRAAEPPAADAAVPPAEQGALHPAVESATQ